MSAVKQASQPQDDWYERWTMSMPEDKLELIDGKLIISTLTGSRRILYELLCDYGPSFVLPMAPAELWWQALYRAFAPPPIVETQADWHTWAADIDYTPAVAPAGPNSSDQHFRLYGILRDGLRHFGQMTQVGEQFGRDWLIRLGENGLTPDLVFINRERLAHDFYDLYLEGPPSLAIEIVEEKSADQERMLKRRLYETAGVPEYWQIEPATMTCTFYRLQPNGLYEAVVIDPAGLDHIIADKKDIVYEAIAVPGLALSLLKLWTMKPYDKENSDRWGPLRPAPINLATLPRTKARDDGFKWDAISFAPRVGLEPTPIQFGEFASWCGRAKFERYGGGLKIDGSEGSRRVAGMLLMTFGLAEVVKLAHPRAWVTFLDDTPYRSQVEAMTAQIMAQAAYEPSRFAHEDETYYVGKVPQGPEQYGYGETLAACEEDLRQMVYNWLLLRIARREPLLAS